MLKWRLFVSTLPYVAAMLGVKLGLERLLGFSGWIDFADLSPLLTAGTFLTGFMLAGTMSDYKEAEKLPAELACVLESIEEMFVHASRGRDDLDLRAQRKVVLETGRDVWDWMHRVRSQPEMYASLERLTACIADLELHGAGPHASRALREVHNLRRAVTRIGVISRTSFIAPGYALLEVLTAVILGMAIIGRFKNFLTEVVLVPFITLIFVYMLRLIRDLDDPFEHRSDGSRGAVDVDLYPLKEYLDRLESRVR